MNIFIDYIFDLVWSTSSLSRKENDQEQHNWNLLTNRITSSNRLIGFGNIWNNCGVSSHFCLTDNISTLPMSISSRNNFYKRFDDINHIPYNSKYLFGRYRRLLVSIRNKWRYHLSGSRKQDDEELKSTT